MRVVRINWQVMADRLSRLVEDGLMVEWNAGLSREKRKDITEQLRVTLLNDRRVREDFVCEYGQDMDEL